MPRRRARWVAMAATILLSSMEARAQPAQAPPPNPPITLRSPDFNELMRSLRGINLDEWQFIGAPTVERDGTTTVTIQRRPGPPPTCPCCGTGIGGRYLCVPATPLQPAFAPATDPWGPTCPVPASSVGAPWPALLMPRALAGPAVPADALVISEAIAPGPQYLGAPTAVAVPGSIATSAPSPALGRERCVWVDRVPVGPGQVVVPDRANPPDQAGAVPSTREAPSTAQPGRGPTSPAGSGTEGARRPAGSAPPGRPGPEDR